ncbi:MAG: endonuclease/exonuclease/phosphatase family protein [Clostridia bacterium]|nr:endonuclease/exonuclease/phosphatase family protein [Clostridia bacterium]
MKIIKTVLKILLCLIALAAVVLFVLNFAYYPRYKLFKGEYDVSAKETDGDIMIVSSNVRCFSPLDFLKKGWFYRAPLLYETVSSLEPDIVGFQEVTPLHYRFLNRTLKGYDSVVLYRDGSLMREGCPIFFNKGRFDLIDKGGFWLSETPDEMSKGWGAAFNRVCSYAILEDRATSERLVVFNTHLDHVSEEARINGIELILQKIGDFGGYPAVIMGDLNCREGSETYLTATESFNDAKYMTDDTDSGATYQDFGAQLDRGNIDYFMLSKSGLSVKSYKVVRDVFDGVYPSDHFPIAIEVSLD